VGLGVLLYVVPALALVTLVLGLANQPASGPLGATAGLMIFAVLIIYMVLFNRTRTIQAIIDQNQSPLPFFGVGIWFSLLSVTTLLLGSLLLISHSMEGSSGINTRKIVTAGMLGAIAITLGVTQLGFIPVLNPTSRATIMHVPAVVGAVLEGPLVGVMAGAIFGLFSWLQADNAIFANPIVAIVPRVLIGLMSWLTYRSLARFNTDMAAAAAGVVGTLTNTVGVLGLAVLFGLLPLQVIPLVIPQALAELVIAAVVAPVVARGVAVTRSGRTVARDTVPREQSYY